ncbi:hypothetical protein ACHAPI_006367 [Fusarium lateritium]
MVDESWDGVLTYMRERNDLFDFGTLDQILEMDDEGSREFTVGVCEGFCDQAEQIIAKLEIAHKRSDLREIGDFADYLRGSAATAGAIKVHDTAQKLKYLALNRDEKDERYMTDEEALPRAEKLIHGFRQQSQETIAILRRLVHTAY